MSIPTTYVFCACRLAAGEPASVSAMPKAPAIIVTRRSFFMWLSPESRVYRLRVLAPQRRRLPAATMKSVAASPVKAAQHRRRRMPPAGIRPSEPAADGDPDGSFSSCDQTVQLSGGDWDVELERLGEALRPGVDAQHGVVFTEDPHRALAEGDAVDGAAEVDAPDQVAVVGVELEDPVIAGGSRPDRPGAE